jgi:hypothetical protein
VTRGRSAGVALLVLYLAAHLVYLPRTLEDLDSINFALGVRHFDVAQHQPHPPGYPVYIALAKISTTAVRAAGFDAASARGLAVLSALAGTLALPALLIFLRRLESNRALALWATVLVALSPLYWFTALRPLTDMPGFAAAMWAMALMSARSTRSIVLGALIAGVAIGLRSQTVMLTGPFLLYVLWRRGEVRAAAAAVGVAAAGALAWAIPLVVASGGISTYLDALNFQADADLGGGIVNLWTHHGARDLLQALSNTFLWPWDWRVGVAVCVLAVIGFLRVSWRSLPAAVGLAIAFAPYAVFHLLFHETVTTRYALPLMPALAYAAIAALEGLPARAMPGAAIGLGVISLLTTMPAARHYGREGAPVFRAFDDMAATAHGGGGRVDAIGFHAVYRRAVEWSEQILPATPAKAPHGREWLPLLALWQGKPEARVWFAADPRRTDLALFDERARELTRPYRWGFPEPPFVGGARPGNVDWYTMRAPNWMLDRGWSVTAEVAGVTAKDHLGPHLAPTVAWIRRQTEALTLVLGGRNLAPSPRVLKVTLNGTSLPDVTVPSGFFFTALTIPAGTLMSGAAYQPFEVKTSGAEVMLLEQFDAQPDGVPMVGLDAGWYEPEFNPDNGLAWRWMSDKAELWVRPIGRDVVLELSGESPLKYFDGAPHVRVLAGQREIAAFDPARDFEQSITIPGDVLAGANGRITVESSKFFVPADRGGGADRRHLALRIYRAHVD